MPKSGSVLLCLYHQANRHAWLLEYQYLQTLMGERFSRHIQSHDACYTSNEAWQKKNSQADRHVGLCARPVPIHNQEATKHNKCQPYNSGCTARHVGRSKPESHLTALLYANAFVGTIIKLTRSVEPVHQCMISSRHVQVRQLYSCVDCDLSVSVDVIRGRRTVDDRWDQLM